MKKILSFLFFVAALFTSLAAKADITVYVQTTDAPFEVKRIYAFGGNAGVVLGGWGGYAFQESDKTTINGKQYYSYTFTKNKSGDDITSVNIVFNNYDGNGSNAQTVDIVGVTESQVIVIKNKKVDKKYTVEQTSLSSFKIDAPAISQNGNFVTITTATKGATIYYSLDGENPTEYNRFEYTAPFEQKADCTIKAIAVKENFQDSEVASLDFTATTGITVYVKKEAPFTVNRIYAWDPSVSGENWITAAWGGDEFQGEVVDGGITFLVYTFDAQYKNINIIFSENGNDKKQTVDVEGVKYSSTFEISSDKDGSKYKVNSIKTTGIESIAEDAEVAPEYFNLQGVKIANPENGLYIKRIGNKAEKVYIR